MENREIDQNEYLAAQQELYTQFHARFEGLRNRITSPNDETDYHALDAEIVEMRGTIEERCREIRAFQKNSQIEESINASLEDLVVKYDEIFMKLGTLYFQYVRQHLQQIETISP